MLQKKRTLVTLEEIRLIDLPNHFDTNGGLIVMEGLENIPFQIVRVFTVIARAGSIRGQHAHYKCSQFLTCPNGSIEVLCDDGKQTKVYILERPNIGLYLPPGIWAQETYISENAVLNVLCDQKYDSEDYIRDYQQFKNFCK